MDLAPSQRAFLSVIAWPDGATRSDAVSLIADNLPPATDQSPHALTIENLRLRIAIQPPFILGALDLRTARHAAAAIRQAGGDAFAPTEQDILNLGPTLKIRDLELTSGLLQATLWRGPDVTIAPASIQSFIRAHLSETVKIRTPERARISQAYYLAGRPHFARQSFMRDTTTTKFQTSDKLDLHTTDARVFQIDGDKFAYDILGDMKGYSDKANMDRMFELFQYLASDAIPDMYFPLFKPPPGLQRLRIPGAALNHDDPIFAFYSRWSALMYRYLTTA